MLTLLPSLTAYYKICFFFLLSKKVLQILQTNFNLLIALADNALSCRPPKFNVAAQAFKLGTENAYTPTAKLMFAHRYLHFVTECATENTRYAGQFFLFSFL